MGVLSREQLRGAVGQEPPLLEGFADAEAQLQPNGFDLTVAQVARFAGDGQIGAVDADRRLPSTEPLAFDDHGRVKLAPGPYLVTFNEVVHLPPYLMALAKPRSSLLRCGVAVHNAVWDAGYHGRSQALLVVYNPSGFSLAQGARIVQLVFLSLERPVGTGYAGFFQGENL